MEKEHDPRAPGGPEEDPASAAEERRRWSADETRFEPLIPLAAAGPLAAGRILTKRFRIVRFIARGGMGDVYEAEDLELGGRLALKTVRGSIAADGRAMARFRREVQLARIVTHPNVSRVFDVFHHQEGDGAVLTFLSMELLIGQLLSERIHEAGPLSPAEALPLVVQIAAGLDAAHRAGVVHRDLKPANVILAGGPDGLRVVVTDFGIARTTDRESAAITGRAETVGSPAYMAPEQVRGAEVTTAADIYSLGVLLYEMVTGTWPFIGDDAISTAAKRLTEPPAPPTKHVPGLDPAWNDTILRCLALAPEERFANATEVVRALRGGIATPSDLPTRRLPATRRRSRSRAAAAVLSIGVAALALFWLARGRGVVPPRRRAVAVLGFKNVSGRAETSWVSTALSEMLTTELSAGGKLRAIAGEDVARSRVELGLGETDALGGKTLARLKKSLGADLVVLGSYTDLGERSGGRLRLDLRLQDTALGETVALVAASGTEEKLFELVSAAGRELREKIGLGAVSGAESGRVQKTLPENAEAAALYAKGLAKLRLFEALEARDLLEKAARIEPRHPLVHSALSSAWSALGFDARAEEEAKRALELAEGLPRAETLAVAARAAEAAHDFKKAIESGRQILELTPDDPEAAFRLAAAQLAGGRGADALATLDALRARLPEGGENARLELMESRAAELLSDHRRQLAAAGRAARIADSLGARLLLAQARASEAKALTTLGDPKRALAASDEAHALFMQAGDLGSAASSLASAAAVLHESGDAGAARKRYEDALAIFQRIGKRTGVASMLDALAAFRIEAGDLAGARSLYEQSLAIWRETAGRLGEARALNNLANVLQLGGDVTGAVKCLEEALTIYRQAGNRGGVGGALNNLAILLKRKGDYPGARRVYDESLAIARENGEKSSVALTGDNLAALLLEVGDVDGAARLAEGSRALAADLGSKGLLGDAQALLARVALVRGDTRAARAASDEALRLRRETGEREAIAESELDVARVLLAEGHPVEAEASGRRAAAELEAEKATDRAAAALAVVSRSLLLQGRREDARKEAERAAALAPLDGDLAERLRIALARDEARLASGRRDEAAAGLTKTAGEADRAGLVPLARDARAALAKQR